MQTEKKTTTAPGAREPNERIYTEPGVYGLIEEPINGLKKAVLVYHEEDEHYLEMFKHFNYTLENYDISSIHITICNVFMRGLDLTVDDHPEESFFASIDEQVHFNQLLDFMSKMAAEEAMHNKMLRIAKREAAKEKNNTKVN